MRRLSALLSLMLAAAVAAPALAASGREAAPVTLTVTRDGERWTAEYVFAGEAPAWAFARSALVEGERRPWRAQSWSVETPGVRLERRGDYDVLAAADGAPLRRVRIAFTPFARGLEADYDPALVFAGGAVALFTGHFDLAPLDSAGAAERLPADLNGTGVEVVVPAATYRDAAGPVALGDDRAEALTSTDNEAYVLFGAPPVAESDAFRSLVDPGLPAWIGEELAAFTPRLLALFGERLGPGAGDRPMVMVSWAGPTPGLRSMGGSVLPGLVTMRFEGEGVLAADPQTLASARWFIAHEGAHFWLGHTVRYARARDAWIFEGGADLLAVRATAALDPAYDARAELQREVDDCARLAVRPVVDAAQRGEHRALYACGAVLALLAEAAAGGPAEQGYFGFVRELIAANREDGVVTADEWFDELTRRSGDPELSAAARRLIEAGASDPAGEIAGLLARAGVGFTRGADGAVRLTEA